MGFSVSDLGPRFFQSDWTLPYTKFKHADNGICFAYLPSVNCVEVRISMWIYFYWQGFSNFDTFINKDSEPVVLSPLENLHLSFTLWIMLDVFLLLFTKSYTPQYNLKIKSLAWYIWILWGILVWKSCRTLSYSIGMPG